ncbi:MAG: ATP-binding cassette domain-containing protein [Planctomycetaceae bacterium]|nr:ATP-binding cassette domain-containing protein [Planctomycetaceae bacterium]
MISTSVSRAVPPPNVVAVVRDVRHRYGDPIALDGVDLEICAGEILALLGPNGSGKSTLFRLLSTLMPIQQGVIEVAGISASDNPLGVRARIGIVFQSPSLDKKLTVDENIACQGALYGISGKRLNARREELLRQLELVDRRGDRCETLSGGLKRRVELVKGMLHHPPLLLLDEPSTGLDPASRLSLWEALRQMACQGVAVLLTSHLMEEADKADRVAIMNRGKIIASDSPANLRAELGDGIVTIQTSEISRAVQWLEDRGMAALQMEDRLRVQSSNPRELVPQLMEYLGDACQSIAVGRPSLEDVFIARTGYGFGETEA